MHPRWQIPGLVCWGDPGREKRGVAWGEMGSVGGRGGCEPVIDAIRVPLHLKETAPKASKRIRYTL